MSIFKENDISLDTFLEDEQVKQARGGDVPLGEYFIDVARGGVKGVSQAVEGLLQLGAMPVDLLFDKQITVTSLLFCESKLAIFGTKLAGPPMSGGYIPTVINIFKNLFFYMQLFLRPCQELS